MGSATAWQLSKAGQKVILLEQQGQEYTFGSSYGETRICRSLGPKNDIWGYLHRRAITETEKLIEFLNTNDQVRHSIDNIYTDSPVTYILHTDKSAVVQRMLRQQDNPYDCAVSPDEAMDKFGITVPPDRVIIQERKQYTGTMNPQELIRKLHRAIQLKGSEIRYHQKVRSISRIADGYEVEVMDKASNSTYNILPKQIVIAAGPYTSSLLQKYAPSIGGLITPKRVFLTFLRIKEKKFESLTSVQKQKLFSFYPLIDLGPDHLFAMIESKNDQGNPLIKVGGHFLRNEIKNLDEVWATGLSEKEIDWGKTSTLEYFKSLGIPLEADDLCYERGYSCVYSLTESEIPIVSNLLKLDNSFDPDAVVLGGMSGVGAKGSLMYGLLATHLLLDEEEDDFMYRKVRNALDRTQ